VKELQQVVGGLSRNSEKIGNIVGVIDDVADQTNLLALNAAIEAARAGEQGRGFAVVADEVRKLAERTTASTKEIASMVKNIQEDTGKAVGSMEVSAKEVSSGVTLANQAGSSLQEIVHEAKGVQEMVQQIATAAEEQSAAAEEISSNVESIASVSKQNAAASEQTSAASQEISRLTDDLQSLVGKFKLNKQVERKQAVARAAHTAASAASYPRQEKKVASFKKELGLDKGAQASA
jgi:methyl-accepting chemotaxis protein